MNDLVSIIIPVYNVRQYLEQCLRSAIGQSYVHIEVLLIDDGSTDGSGELCDKLSAIDARISVFHKTNGGLSSARNYGLSRAKGDYIYFLDSDDYIEDNTIEILLNKCIDNNLDMIVFGGHCFWDSEVDSLTKKQYENVYRRGEGYITNSGSSVYMQLKEHNEYYPAVPMHFYKTSFLNKNQLTFQDGILHEDELFSTYAYLYAERANVCSDRFYWRRMRENSIMTEKVSSKNVESCGFIVEQIVDSLNKCDDKMRTKNQQDMLKMALSHCLWLFFLRYNLLDKTEKKSIKVKYGGIVKAIKEKNYYSSIMVKKCFKNRVWLPLRNNPAVYKVYKVITG